ncbi:HipA domain-containing protein [Xanthomonas campestris pv. raphani]|uniref:HipA domain-containing protein n=1 Tax=Xanthomonas campestris TaxID=339 RepID=UPI002B23895A|nr:HipA domain-containing protein [Xanthomonas campestris]MEA9773399.1 HipA domain-containing protein [Xanthomonas campestris pv. raphani]MEA9801569.1 HipA domain-containing protein [Xanthomonas campestris pv. raphani]
MKCATDFDEGLFRPTVGLPNSCYAQIVQAIERWAEDGKVTAQREELFSRMIFNIMITIDDDHLRNHAFVHEMALGTGALSMTWSPSLRLAPSAISIWA